MGGNMDQRSQYLITVTVGNSYQLLQVSWTPKLDPSRTIILPHLYSTTSIYTLSRYIPTAVAEILFPDAAEWSATSSSTRVILLLLTKKAKKRSSVCFAACSRPRTRLLITESPD